MGLKTSMSNELPRRGVNIAIYGAAGTGKTTIASDLADSEYGKPVTIIDAEGGSSVLSHRDDIEVISIDDSDGKGWIDTKNVVEKIISGNRKHKTGAEIGTLIIDNLSEFRTLSLEHVVRTNSRPNVKDSDRPDQNDWGKSNTALLMFVRDLRDFSRNSNTNVIFIVWDLPEMNTKGEVMRNAINMNPAFRRDFPGIVDCVGYLKVSMGRRVLSFAASQSTDAKFRRNGTELANTIPDTLKYKEKKVQPLCDIIATLVGAVPFPVAKYGKVTEEDA